MSRIRIHYLQHVPFEGLGNIEMWINYKGHEISSTKFYENDILPEVYEYDWLIVMGGPMGVYEEQTYPWLKKEKEFIKEAIYNDKIVIGICLGSQLIADVLGASVYKNKNKEIGWFPIFCTEALKRHHLFKHFPTEMSVFHWHGDTFDMPKGAVQLFKSKACLNQGFIYNGKVIGFQFHPEATQSSIMEMINDGKDELVKDTYVQNIADISKHIGLADLANKLLSQLLDILEIQYFSD